LKNKKQKNGKNRRSVCPQTPIGLRRLVSVPDPVFINY